MSQVKNQSTAPASATTIDGQPKKTSYTQELIKHLEEEHKSMTKSQKKVLEVVIGSVQQFGTMRKKEMEKID